MIDLKLDTNAVMKLFDTEEARSKLQMSVINNVVQELVLKNSKNKVQETIQKEISLVGARLPDVAPLVKEQMNMFFEKKGWNEVKGTLELDRLMREAANSKAYDIVVDLVTKQVDKAIDDLQDKIDDMLKVSEARMQTLIQQRLNTHFGSCLNKAIAERMATAFPDLVVKQ